MFCFFLQDHDKAHHNSEFVSPFNQHKYYKNSQVAFIHFNMRTSPKVTHRDTSLNKLSLLWFTADHSPGNLFRFILSLSGTDKMEGNQ